jgi:transposase
VQQRCCCSNMAKPIESRHPSGFDLRGQLYRITGVDLTQIDGIDLQNARTIVSEVGVDMSRWKTEKHFASWLGLCPANRISGGKVLKRGTRQVVNRASTALRLAASALLRSRSAWGPSFADCAPSSGHPKLSLPWRTCSLVWSTGC